MSREYPFGREKIKNIAQYNIPFICPECEYATGFRSPLRLDISKIESFTFVCSRCDNKIEFTEPFEDRIKTTQYKILIDRYE